MNTSSSLEVKNIIDNIEKNKKRSKIVLLLVLIVIIVLSLSKYCFYQLNEKSKKIFFYETSHKVFIKEQLTLLKSNEEINDTIERSYENKDDKALIVVQKNFVRLRKNQEYSEDFSYKEEYDNNINAIYYEFEDIKTEIVIREWRYSSKNFWGERLNLYADVFGEEEAKGKPNYPYYISFYVYKPDCKFIVDAFCNNPNFFLSLLDESVAAVNAG